MWLLYYATQSSYKIHTQDTCLWIVLVGCMAVKFPNNIIARGPDSSVGVATDYRLDGPGSNPGGDEIFRLSKPALGPTQPPVK